MAGDARLAATSHLSWIDGVQHHLRALGELDGSGDTFDADMIQSAGTAPIDVGGTGIDFVASGIYR